jgi:hypothetical protein
VSGKLSVRATANAAYDSDRNAAVFQVLHLRQKPFCPLQRQNHVLMHAHDEVMLCLVQSIIECGSCPLEASLGQDLEFKARIRVLREQWRSEKAAVVYRLVSDGHYKCNRLQRI